MKRHQITLLVLSDEDMNCNIKQKTIKEIKLEDVGFSLGTVLKYELIVYEGSKGTKILKSNYTKKGEIA